MRFMATEGLLTLLIDASQEDEGKRCNENVLKYLTSAYRCATPALTLSLSYLGRTGPSN